jgi:hypothetical protein
MRQDEYIRLYKACLAMTKQSPTPDVQARWHVMAEVWLKRATEECSPSGRRALNRDAAA